MGLGNGMYAPMNWLGGVGKEAGNFLLFGKPGDPDYKLPEGVVADPPVQGRQGIDGHAGGLELGNFVFNDLQVIFQTGRFGIGADDFSTTPAAPFPQSRCPRSRHCGRAGRGILRRRTESPVLRLCSHPPETC